MKYIPLTRGKVAIVDDIDYPELSKYKWQYSILKSTEYARRGVFVEGKTKTIRMHRQIMGVIKGQEIDHLNRNGLDNRRENLRICTRAENVRNVRKRKDSPNEYKGTHFVEWKQQWLARIQIKGRRIAQGYFKTELEAAKAYDKLAKKHHGVFASLNFPT